MDRNRVRGRQKSGLLTSSNGRHFGTVCSKFKILPGIELSDPKLPGNHTKLKKYLFGDINGRKRAILAAILKMTRFGLRTKNRDCNGRFKFHGNNYFRNQ